MSYSSQVKGFGKSADARDNAASKSVAVDPTKPIAVPSIGGSNADIRENNANLQADRAAEEQKILAFLEQSPRGKEIADQYKQYQRDLSSPNKEKQQDATGGINLMYGSMQATYAAAAGDPTKTDKVIADISAREPESAWMRLGQPIARNVATMAAVVGTAGALSAGATGVAEGGGLTAAQAESTAALSGTGGSGIGLSAATTGELGAGGVYSGSVAGMGGGAAVDTTAASVGLGTQAATDAATTATTAAAGTNTLGDFVGDNAGSLLNTGLGLYNASQQGDAAQAIADQNERLNAPWHDAGVNALSQMTDGLQDGGQFSKKYTLADYQQDPYNKFLQDEGTQAIDRSAASKGTLGSGNVLAELSKYGQGMAGQGYNEQYNRFTQGQTNDWNRLSSLAGTGQTAAQQISNGNAYGIQGGANATSAGLGSLGAGFNSMTNNPEQYTFGNHLNGLANQTSNY